MPYPKTSWRVLWSLLVLLGVYALALVAYSQSISSETSERVFSETGFFEQISPWLWLSLGAMAIAVVGRLDLVAGASAAVCIACAAREWDMHKEFTGYSMLKPGFYLSSEYPLHQQLLSGLSLVILAASCVGLVWHLWRIWPRGRQPVPPWMWAMFASGGMLVGTKLLDRMPNILLEEFDVALGPAMLRLFRAWEEGLEASLPLAFGASIWAYRIQWPRPDKAIDSAD